MPAPRVNIVTVMMMTKDYVLAILMNARGCVSGERISKTLGLSRAAVNAAVRALRGEGYDISSSTRTGYTLVSSPGRLCAGELLARLGEKRMESVACLESVGSTNDHLKELAAGGAPAGTVVIANEQTAGRGRQGRSFLSPPDAGIYLSMLFRPECDAGSVSQLTAWTGAAVCRALASSGVSAGVKWVNDIVMNGRKLGGILTELAVEGESGRIQYAVIGVGVNAGQDSFPPELADIAASVYMETGRRIPRGALAADIIRELDALRADFPGKRAVYLDAYRALCVTLGREVTYVSEGAARRGTAEGIADDFALLVRRPDGSTEALRSGEVSVRGLCGYV